MNIKLGKYTFEGPYQNTSYLEDRPGVFAVLTKENDQYVVLDFGESAKVRTMVQNSDRRISWERHSSGLRYIAVYYTPYFRMAGRMEIEQELRNECKPVCRNNIINY
jgi:hypothetical protein